MSNSSQGHRRYEILLPRRFNDGRPIPDDRLGRVLLDLRGRFGALSLETQVIQGIWQQAGETFRDELIRLFIDVEDTEANHKYFVELKEQLKTQFEQIEIWIVSYPIRVE